MNKYPLGHRSQEAQQWNSSTRYRFHSTNGLQRHEWCTTQARLIFFAGPLEGWEIDKKWTGLYLFDEGDEDMAIQLRDLMTANDRPTPDQAEVHKGLGQIIQDVIFLINSVWTDFFVEAELHLQVLVSSLQRPTEIIADSSRASSALIRIFSHQSSSSICRSSMSCRHSGFRSADI